MRIVSGTTGEKVHFVAFSTADHITRVTGLTSFNTYLSIAGSTGTVGATTCLEINSTQMAGIYAYTITDSTIFTLGAGVDSREVCLHITSSMDPVTRTFEVYRRTATTGQTLALNTSGKIADVESILTKATSIDTNVSSVLTKVTSVDTNVSSVLTKVTSVDTNVSSVLTKVTSIDTNVSSALTKVTSVNTNVDSVKAKTDSLNFTVANFVDANIQYVNDVAVTGTGSTVDPWGP